MLAVDIRSLMRTDGVPDVSNVGVREATTFTGFCSHHDSETFRPLETQPFESTPEQCFLLGYRAACKTLHEKMAYMETLDIQAVLDCGRPVAAQRRIQEQVFTNRIGATLGLRDIRAVKSDFDAALLDGDWTGLSYYTVLFTPGPDFLASGMATLETDLGGELLQDPDDLRQIPDHVGVSLISTDTGGAFVLSWLNHRNDAGKRFTQSLHVVPDSQKPRRILHSVFGMLSNVCIAPTWWDNLSQGSRAAIRKRALSGAHPDYPLWDLTDDGHDVVHWTVSAVRTNLSL